MKTYGIEYLGFLVFLIFLFRLSNGDVGNLPQLSKGFRQDFTPEDENGQWTWFKGSPRHYSIQKRQEWLVSDWLNTTGIKEVSVVVEFQIDSSESIRNKTNISIAVITNGTRKPFIAKGNQLKGSSRLKVTQLLQLNSPQTRFGIQPSGDRDGLVVYSVKITYFFCPEKTFNGLAHFPRTHSPRNGSLPVKVKGVCSKKFSNTKPVANCGSNGNWSYNETFSCDCGPGYIATAAGCNELKEMTWNIKAIRQSSTQALLSWDVPRDVLISFHYRVDCKKCQGGRCNSDCNGVTVRKPLNDRQESRSVTGLEGGRKYVFTVSARKVDSNDSSDGKMWNSSVTLRELPGKIRNITFTSQAPDRIVLFWRPPINWPRADISYEVACEVNCLQGNCSPGCPKLQFTPSRNNLLQTNVTVRGFGHEGNRYIFKIYSKNRWYDFSEYGQVEWNFNAINFTETSRTAISNTKKFNVVDVLIGVSVLIFAVIVTVVVTVCYNRWKVRKHNLTINGENMEHLCNGEVQFTTSSTAHYVDPSNYENVKLVLRRFTKKLNEKFLKTEQIIGEGEFGVVWKGYLDIPGEGRATVAVKSLRDGVSPKLRHDFLTEASIMGQFKDPNVISLYGVVLKKNSVKIVMEYMSNGSLNKYLMDNNGGLTTLQLLGMARGIASGMKYLSGRNFIHRDLAARNILVDKNLCCKVADFGLTREICATSNYETRGGKIPLRWTAPEVIKHKKSFIASDVWSYGVVLWEIMSFGQRPYWEWDNLQVLQEIESGYRLPAPLKCPKRVHSLMLSCWEKERTKRPQFSFIIDKLDEWIRSPETVHQSPALEIKRSHGKRTESVDSHSPIQQWLDAIKMGKYGSNFHDAGYTTLSQVADLTEEDLLAMGIKLVGHRHKIHQSIPLAVKSDTDPNIGIVVKNA